MVDILIVLVLIGFNAFFSLAEVALISARRTRMVVLAEQGSRAAQMAIDLMDNPDKFLSVAQFGITIVSILTGIYTGAEMSDDFSAFLIAHGVAASTAPIAAKAIILVVATYMQCVLGELFPKRIALDLADLMARLSAPPMVFFAALAKPFVWLMTLNTRFLAFLFHLKKEENRVTEEEIKSVIQEGTESGELNIVEQDIMERAMVMGDQNVDQLMTYRTDIVTLDINMSAADVKAVICESPFANYPVIDGDIDNIVGFTSLKDLVLQMDKDEFSLRDCVQKPIYLPENLTVYKALEHLKKYHSNFAFICDEFGALQGIVTYRDIFEGLVGTIQDREDEPDIILRSDKKSWVVSGQCPYYEFLEHFDRSNLYQSEFNTLAGLILVLLDHIPHVGERCEWEGLSFHVVEMEGNRIAKVVVEPIETPAAS